MMAKALFIEGNDNMQEKENKKHWKEILESCKNKNYEKLQEIVKRNGRLQNFIPSKNATLLDLVKLNFISKNQEEGCNLTDEQNKIITLLRKNGGTSTMFLKTPLIIAPVMLAFTITLASNFGIVIGMLHASGLAFCAPNVLKASLIVALTMPSAFINSIPLVLMVGGIGILYASGSTVLVTGGIVGTALLYYVGSNSLLPNCMIELTDSTYQYFHPNVIEPLTDVSHKIDKKVQQYTNAARETIEGVTKSIANKLEGWTRGG